MVTKAGELYLFGKDSSQCDWSGHVIELKGHQTIQAAMGKAHVVVLTKDGDVYTFGMNNKGKIIVCRFKKRNETFVFIVKSKFPKRFCEK